jgi:hypothetical protein
MKAKGRNGWIAVAGSSAWTPVHGEQVYLDLWSKRQGRHPPLQISGNPGEMERLALMVLAAVEEAKAAQALMESSTCSVGALLTGHQSTCPVSLAGGPAVSTP